MARRAIDYLEPPPFINSEFDEQWRLWLSRLRDRVEEMSNSDFYYRVANGQVPGHSLVKKFGSGSVGTSVVPITQTQDYQTPTTAQALEFVSNNANDTAAGSGAQEITIQGLDSNWEQVTQTLETNGTTAVALGTNLTRLYRWYVSRSGTYATSTAGSHAGILTIQGSGGGTVWDTIPVAPFPMGQSQIGVYSIPSGKKAFLYHKNVHVDTNKSADVFFFQRPIVDDVTTPYTGTMRLVNREVGAAGSIVTGDAFPSGPFVGPCDIGYMGEVSTGTADISVNFELLLVDV